MAFDLTWSTFDECLACKALLRTAKFALINKQAKLMKLLFTSCAVLCADFNWCLLFGLDNIAVIHSISESVAYWFSCVSFI